MGVLQTPALPLGYAAIVGSAAKVHNPEIGLERETGFEPATFSLARRRSTPELLPHDRRLL